MQAGADPNAIWRGYRPLHALIQERSHGEALPTDERVACLDWLLEHGADPELPGAWPPARALVIAAFGGAAVFVERLLAGGARRDAFTACALGERSELSSALAREPSLARERDVGGLTALMCAAGSRLGTDDPDLADALIAIATELCDAGADLNARTMSWSHEVDAAYLAASRGSQAMLAFLLGRGADPTAALVSAAWVPRIELIDLCLAHGGDPERAEHEGKPLLNQLVRWGQVQPALALLARGASPNRADERGWTALHQAASRGNARMLAACLASGGDRWARDSSGSTPSDVARAKGRAAIVAALAAP